MDLTLCWDKAAVLRTSNSESPEPVPLFHKTPQAHSVHPRKRPRVTDMGCLVLVARAGWQGSGL